RKAADGEVTEFFKFLLFGVLDVVGLFSDNDDDRARLENLNELVNSVREFVKNNAGASVADYLQTVSLYSDTYDMTGDNAVTLATVHSAKGLEFPVVFVVGLEDGIFPSMRMNENSSNHIEEERRLMYVAVTRARKRLFLTYAKARYLYGETQYKIPSRFLTECGLVERQYNSADVYTNSPSYRGVYGFARSSDNLQSAKPIKQFDGGEKFSGAYKSGFNKTQPQQADAKPSAANVDKSEFVVGATVMHKRLGKGTIIGLENMGDSLYAKIDFERGGVMLLAVDFAPLTVIKG
ncbi:MAG: ATP-binding domain-containing protein, partial [Clostridiales bacterium]|nr:ATP-binding domain-containing protein [Clostridiales bacterium]